MDKQYRIISEEELYNFLKLNSMYTFRELILQYTYPTTKLIKYVEKVITNKISTLDIDALKFILKNFKYIKFEGIYWNTSKEDRKIDIYLNYYDGYRISIFLYFFTLYFKY